MTRHQIAAEKRGAARTAAVEQKVKDAVNTITAEIKENGGIYPHKGGSVSLNEVARRAGISESTLHAEKQKELKEYVDNWLENLKKKETIGRVRVSRTYAERAEDWKALYLALQTSHVQTELDLQTAQYERDEAIEEAKQLRKQNNALRKQLDSSGVPKVVPIPKPKGKA